MSYAPSADAPPTNCCCHVAPPSVVCVISRYSPAIQPSVGEMNEQAQ
jgi:hypothetical protein